MEFQLQHHSFQRNPRADLLQNGLVGSPCSPRDSQESSPHHSSKASILRHLAVLMDQLSHPYMTTGNTISSVHFSHSVVSDSVTPWTAAHQASLSITNSRSLPKPMPTVSVRPSNHLILCRPLLLLPSIFPSIRVFSNESALRIRWPKYWSFSFNISPSNEHPGLISFRMDWLDLLSVQGTLKSLLHTTVQKHQFFSTQLSLVSNYHIHT